MTTQDMQQLVELHRVIFQFGIFEGVFFTLGALKLCDLLLITFDRIFYRIRRYTTRAA